MTFEQVRNDETRAAVNRVEGLEDVALVRVLGVPMIWIRANMGDLRLTTYVSRCQDVESDVAYALSQKNIVDAVEADVVDQAIEDALAIEGVEGVEVQPMTDGYLAYIRMVVPGSGAVNFPLSRQDQNWRLATEIARIGKRRRQDAEGRTLGRLGAMSMAMAASDPDDLDRIVDTVFIGGDVDYRGITSAVRNSWTLTTSYETTGVRIRSDGIEMGGLPETVKLALRADMFKDQPLSKVIDIPGFDDLRIAKIDGRAEANRKVMGGAGWMRIDVRDADGARLDDLYHEEARDVARETFERRRRLKEGAA